MTTLLKNGLLVNVFLDELQEADVLFSDDGTILGVGKYEEADVVVDVAGKILSPAFIDGHIHIESTMLLPDELARVCLPHGTASIVADPHEIANVCGKDGIDFMIQASEGVPMEVFFTLPSCVPSTPFDESGAVLEAADLRPYYDHPRVLGLAEMMNYPGVLAKERGVMEKIADAKKAGKVVNGHAPLLRGKSLDAYLSAGIQDDHECSSFAEGKERVEKGQWVMIREGTSARNLAGLIDLFDEPYSRRCLLVTDDKHPKDLRERGHIDMIVREAIAMGKSPFAAIRMASLQAAECFRLPFRGAIAPGYRADILVLDSLEEVTVRDVYLGGKLAVRNGEALPFPRPRVEPRLLESVSHTFFLPRAEATDFLVAPAKRLARVIKIIPGELLSEEMRVELDFERGNGISVERDLLKIAVVERHRNSGHKAVGFIHGIGLKRGAIASSCSHDAHNIVVIGTSESEMAAAVNAVKGMGGGFVAVEKGKTLAACPLPIGGLMSPSGAEESAKRNEEVRAASHALGAPECIEPFMVMNFMALPVIPHLKMSTKGIVDVDAQKVVPLFVE